MMSTSEENASISTELDSISGALKERIEDYRRKEDLSVNQKFFKFVGLFMKNSNVLGKESLSNADIKQIHKTVVMDIIYEQVHSAIEEMITSDKFKSDSAGSVFELYDTMVKRIIGRQNLLVALLEVMSYIVAFHAFLFTYLILDHMQDPDAWFYPRGLIYTSSMIFLASLNRLLERYAERTLTMISKKKSLIMTVLVYYKLLASDISFLESADNNLIYRAFYWDMEEYSNFQYNFIPVMIVPLILLLHITFYKYIVDSSFFYYGFSMLGKSVFLVILGAIRSSAFRKYRKILTKERETIYEWLVNAKSARFANMRERFMDKLRGIQESRTKVLNRLYNNYLTTYYLSKQAELLTPVIMVVLVVVRYYDRLVDGHKYDESYPESQFFKAPNLLTWFCVYIYYEGRLKKEIDQLDSFFRSRVSKTFYDQYFSNDSIINRALTVDSSLGIGEIQLQDCTVLMREQIIDKQDIASVFPGINSIEESESKRNISIASINNSATDQDINKRNYYFIKVIDNLTLKVASGERLCVEATKETLAITGFFRLLIGEAFVSKGSMRVNGNVSYFNREKMPFLEGKTIRDNILFGEEFNINRYESVLSTLRVKFDQYLGSDFYQVTESGLNLKSDDRLFILLSRFLYKNCNIYIAEDLFMDFNFVIVNPIFDRIMSGFFQGKTLIFMSNVPKVIGSSSLVLRLKSNYQYDVQPPNKSMLEKNENKNHPSKVFTTQGKIGNFIFIQNLSYVEELAIHKKLKQQKKEIKAKMMTNTNIVEKIAYGIYLTNKRRQEGTNIEELKEVTPTELMDFSLSFLKNKGRVRYLLFINLLVNCFHSLFLSLTEYYLLARFYDKAGHRIVLSVGLTDLITIVCLYLTSSAIGLIQVVVFKRLILDFIDKLNHASRSHIIDGSFFKLKRMRYHEMLSRVNEHLPCIEIKTFTLILMLCDSICSIFWYFLVLICVYSVVLPLILICLLVFAIIYTFRRLLPFYFKAISFAYHNQHKKDDFNFQLLSTILGYRISGCLKKLNTKFLKLSDNLARSENLANTDYKMMFTKVSALYTQIFCVGMIGILYLNVNSIGWNFVGPTRRAMIWGFVVTYRVFIKIEYFIRLLLEALGEILKVYKFWSFLPQSDRNFIKDTKPKYTYTYKPPDTDYSKPIILKNISLTLGYKPVLKQVNIKIRPMQRVGIVGFEGCGRSSIFDLLMGAKQEDPKENSDINLFGIKLEYVSKDNIRNQMHFMSAKPLMVEGTVRENIDLYGRFTDEVIIKILKELHIEKVLRQEALKNQIKISSEDVDEQKTQQREAFRHALNYARVSVDSGNIKKKQQPATKSNKVRPLAKPVLNNSSPTGRVPKQPQNKVIMNIKLDAAKEDVLHTKKVDIVIIEKLVVANEEEQSTARFLASGRDDGKIRDADASRLCVI